MDEIEEFRHLRIVKSSGQNDVKGQDINVL